MPPPEQQPYDDRYLTQYLLGALPAEDAESMDVLCISDEELSARLVAIENDLVDAYVRNELAREDLDQFRSFFLASAHRLRKVEFAAALLEAEKKRAAAPVATPVATPAVAVPAPKAQAEPMPSPKPPVRRPMFRWGFALAAAAVVLVAAYAGFDDWRLRRQISDAQAQPATLDQRGQQLQKELDQQRSANAETAKELERLRQSQTNLEQLKIVSVLLPPPSRGAARPPTVTVQSGSDLAVLMLALEADDFPQYRASLKDPVANQLLWSSANLQSASLGDKKTVSISFPAGLLKQQNYVVELTGLPAHGAPAAISSYPFRAVLK